MSIIQVAGIIDAKEADMLINEGVDWLGFPLRLPSGRDDISESEATSILQSLPKPHRGVLISYMTEADEVSRFCDQLCLDAVQLHGDISMKELAKLREARPDLYLLKSLVVRSDNMNGLLQLIDDSSEWVDMYITDTFDPITGAKGATGITHDWSVSKELVRHSERPLMMAGGLSPENIGEAIREVQPAAIDAHSLLEGPDGRKDRNKIRRFVSEARAAFDEIGATTLV
ncbi:phosphoribosylanthranilate isomerase [Chromohalobacter marismortui]|uniref:N-(5'-phosphoribosyl)anthranilate isomerase n=1 Tax=Chromohalobacter marismortui TaxID=42055 RepID=A0A4R7NTL3_9GAMM|nr:MULTISPECIES: phosphoribosylanthranilate isomerase [Chromohalobacter]MCI0509070.1 phosphoribosylanthranilate isomerase [Chromohalobacter sp.]MCI0592825.1 phosphoribosylanthranilate isomerase [Chromohalobacter sp.]TDU24039.1 phosphoribosylanthranilate isomerase [Chromohalobacter marismortui]